jgi:hypothetical protein
MEQLKCLVRNMNVRASPEEIVRQKLIHWLVQSCGIPKESLQLEVLVGQRRADLVVWRKIQGQLCIWLLAECKAPGIGLEQAELQLSRYMELGVKSWILVTNGKHMKVWTADGDAWRASQSFPKW